MNWRLSQFASDSLDATSSKQLGPWQGALRELGSSKRRNSGRLNSWPQQVAVVPYAGWVKGLSMRFPVELCSSFVRELAGVLKNPMPRVQYETDSDR